MSEYLRLSAGGYGFLLPREAIAAVRVIEAGIAPLALHQRAPRPSVYIDARQSVDDSRKLRNLGVWKPPRVKPIRTAASSVSSSIAPTALKPMIRTRFKPCRAVLPF
jgi:hypothetical protein